MNDGDGSFNDREEIACARMLEHASNFFQKHISRNDPNSLDEAISIWTRVLEVGPPSPSLLLRALQDYCVGLHVRFLLKQDLRDLHLAIRAAQHCLPLVQSPSPHRLKVMKSLASLHFVAFQQSASESELSSAIDATQDCLDLAQTDADVLFACMIYAPCLTARFKSTANIQDFELAVKAAKQVLASEPYDKQIRCTAYSSLADLWFTKFEITDSLADLRTAIASSRHAYKSAREGNFGYVQLLKNLSVLLTTLCKRDGDGRADARAHIDEVIAGLQESALFAFQGGDAHRQRWEALCVCFRWRYGQFGELQDLDELISAFETSIGFPTQSSAERVTQFTELSDSLLVRYRYRGVEADLKRSIAVAEKAVTTAGSDDALSPSALLSLARAQLIQIERSGDPNCLAAAYATARKVVKMPQDAEALDVLARIYFAQYRYSDAREDLEWAIDCWKSALAVVPKHSEMFVVIQAHLGVGCHHLFTVTRDPADLSAAIAYLQHSSSASGRSKFEEAQVLNSLGAALQTRYMDQNEPGDLDASLECYRRAVEIADPNWDDYALYIGNLASGRLQRYFRNQDVSELDTALDLFVQALWSAKADSVNYSGHLRDLAVCLSHVYAYAKDPVVADGVSNYHRAACVAGLSTNLANARDSASDWLDWCLRHGNWIEASTAAIFLFIASVKLEGQDPRNAGATRDGGEAALMPEAIAFQYAARKQAERVVETIEEAHRIAVSPWINVGEKVTCDFVRSKSSRSRPLAYVAASAWGTVIALVLPTGVDCFIVDVDEATLWEYASVTLNERGEVDVDAHGGAGPTAPEFLECLGAMLSPLADRLRSAGADSVRLIPWGFVRAIPLHAAMLQRSGRKYTFGSEFRVDYAMSARNV